MQKDRISEEQQQTDDTRPYVCVFVCECAWAQQFIHDNISVFAISCATNPCIESKRALKIICIVGPVCL